MTRSTWTPATKEKPWVSAHLGVVLFRAGAGQFDDNTNAYLAVRYGF